MPPPPCLSEAPLAKHGAPPPLPIRSTLPSTVLLAAKGPDLGLTVRLLFAPCMRSIWMAFGPVGRGAGTGAAETQKKERDGAGGTGGVNGGIWKEG